jgi:hypothetical protein
MLTRNDGKVVPQPKAHRERRGLESRSLPVSVERRRGVSPPSRAAAASPRRQGLRVFSEQPHTSNRRAVSMREQKLWEQKLWEQKLALIRRLSI